MTKYAVQIEIESGEYMMVASVNPWTYMDEPKLFNSYEEATKEAMRWNTGKVLEYDTYIGRRKHSN